MYSPHPAYCQEEPIEGVTVSDAQHLLEALEPTVAENLDRHLGLAQEWHPHDYIPWSEGRDFAFLGGEDWAPEQSRLSETAKAAMITNLLTEDNLPSYHREIATRFSSIRSATRASSLSVRPAKSGAPRRSSLSMVDPLCDGHPPARPWRASTAADGVLSRGGKRGEST